MLIAVPEDDKNGQVLHDYRMNADDALEVRLQVKAGTRLVAAGFTDSAPSPERVPRRGRLLGGDDPNWPGIDMLYISGPFNGKTPEATPSRQRIFTCRPAAARDEEPCARQIFSTLAKRAYRRPVTDADIAPLVAIYKEGRAGRDFDAGVERGLEALLSSPKFLLRIERESAGAARGVSYRVSDLELASRLSFFLWRSLPDDELIDIAARNQLRGGPRSAGQAPARRSPRLAVHERLLRAVARGAQPPGRSTRTRRRSTIRSARPWPGRPSCSSRARCATDRPLPELLRADYTFLNEQLARHYGITNIYGSHFRRVTMTDPRRQGLLGHASVLTVTSYADRTSVVLRGKWILENLLGAPPPPPPPNVPPLKENDGRSKPEALRERMEQHRNNAVCSSCHARMDPLGFALEHYDAIGGWRESDSGAAINSTIALHGETIDSPKAFREALLTQTDEFPRTVSEKLLTYALGRGLDVLRRAGGAALTRELAAHEYRWSSLIAGHRPEHAVPDAARDGSEQSGGRHQLGGRAVTLGRPTL